MDFNMDICQQQQGANGVDKASLTQVPHGLTNEQIGRYSRHVILPQFGVHKQEQLCKSSVVVVGCGGLGCPVALYLAGSGVGTLGLVDCDAVDVSNLHRQIGHSENRVGIHKADSLKDSCLGINSSIKVEVYKDGLNAKNALQIVVNYDVVVDASDNAPTRYLVSDVCVIAGKPLVSGAAIGLYGQLTIYNYEQNSPCYRCIHPDSPQPESCQRCNEAGVLGVVPGIIGNLQALETIKIISNLGEVLDRKLLLFDATTMEFRRVKLRDRNPKCIACGDEPKITSDNLSFYDYFEFTGQQMNDNDDLNLCLLSPEQRIDGRQLQKLLSENVELEDKSEKTVGVLLLDVRPKEQFDVGHIKGSLNFPIGSFRRRIDEIQQLILNAYRDQIQGVYQTEVCVVCKRGNDSQLVVQQLDSLGLEGVIFKDLVGGLQAWSEEIDSKMPSY
eukprot:TRINITY_DN2894_c0_g1_i5.p2 TRINITY_DN2894_c0_g1~~TRINITY_DN2894_c0_g1_i5.p2  ORF type:complete len:444 (+),score=48.00 TRINITY_DN2894_c0_g1_i5:120-1451(+)